MAKPETSRCYRLVVVVVTAPFWGITALVLLFLVVATIIASLGD